jgi:hypothetical protein
MGLPNLNSASTSAPANGASGAVLESATLTENTRLRRGQAAAALTAAGYPTAHGTLDNLVTRGDGPPFVRYGKHAIYRWGELLAWAKTRDRSPGTPGAGLDPGMPRRTP